MTIPTGREEPRNAPHRGLPRVRVVEVAAPAAPRPHGTRDEPPALWHVLHTRARQEKAVARALRAAGIDHFLPLAERVTYSGRRKRKTAVPLFPSYVFMRGPAEATYLASSTGRIANIIRAADQECLARELGQIRRAMSSGADLRPDRYLTVGRPVRVTAGPFRDIEGLIEERARAGRLVLQVAALGRATSLEIDADLLEPVD